MGKRFFIVGCLVGLLINIFPAFSKELHNIALGRPYVWSTPPDCVRCTESGDRIQLTDGEKKGSYWQLGSTVGWDKKEVEITIDLGWERKFEEVRIFTRNNHWWVVPSQVKVFVSNDNQEFKQIGFFAQGKGKREINEWRGCSQTISIPTPGSKGRYVKILIKGIRDCIYCDEIEVLSSSPKLLEVQKRKQKKDGSYNYTLSIFDPRGKEIILQGWTPWGEVLFEKRKRISGKQNVNISFSLPSELCHLLVFDLRDAEGRILERCLERITYFLPTSLIKPVQKINLEDDWFYQIKNPGEKISNSEWKKFNLKERFYSFHPFYAQEKPKVIWYRKEFSLSSIKDKVIKLKLNRVRYAPEIYLNGKLVSEKDLETNLPHIVDLTNFIKEGKNELIIKLYDWRGLLVKGAGPFATKSYRKFKKEFWFAMAPSVSNSNVSRGEYTFIYPLGTASGKDYKRFGILDKVEILLFPKVYIEDIRITPSVRKKKLKVEITLKNEDNKKHKVFLSNIIGDIKNPYLKKLPDIEVELAPFTTKKVYIEEEWENPILWWPKRPYLYHLSTILKENNEILETKDTRFGFREISVDGPVLKLNGKRLHLFGVHHSDPFGKGSYGCLKLLEEHNFNTWRTWGGTSGEELLKAADEMGIFIIDESNHFWNYINASQEFWDNCFSHFKRRVKRDYNHPSVIGYSTQNEFRSAPWTTREWVKKKMDELIQRMIKEDPTRVAGHEGSFCKVGSCSGSETILLPHYAAEARERGPESQEYLLPNYYYRWKETFKGTCWETRPVYIGEMGLAWDFRSNIPDASTMYNVGDKIYRNWRQPRRSFDPRVTAQFLPMEIDAMRYNQLVGVSPNTWHGSPEIIQICRSHFSPFYIQIMEYSHLFYGGEKIRRRIVVYNDFLDGKGKKKFTLLYQLKDDKDNIFDKGRKTFLIEDGEKKEMEITFTTPEVKERKEVEFSLQLFYNNKIVFEKKKNYSILPRIKKFHSTKRILLYDTTGETSSFFNNISLNYTDVEFSTLNPEKDILVIGKNSLDEEILKNKEKIEEFVKKGGVVISFTQKKNYQWLPIPLILDTTHPSTINYLRAPGHPLLRGIKEDDLKFWGEDNLTASGNFKKPVVGGYRAIVDTAGIKGLLWSPLLEIPYYQGTYILCQFKIIEKFSSEPAAGLLLRNMLEYANQHRRQPSTLVLLKETDEKIKKMLLSTGIEFDELDSVPEKLTYGYNLCFLGGKIKLNKERKEKIKKFVKEGGIIILHNLTPSSSLLSLLPEKVSLRRVNINHPKKAVIHTEYTPITYGMSNQIFYWLGKVPPEGPTHRPWPPSPEIAKYCLKLSKGSKAEILLDPPLLVKFPSGKGYFLVDQINWENASGSHKVKAKEYLRILFTNLGVPVKAGSIRREKSCFPVDISSFCNMGFVDEEAGDGKGGWTDQGPTNDLRTIPLGNVNFKGVSFFIIDPQKNDGKSCIVLKSIHSSWGIEKVKGIKVGRKTSFLYFLHASAWTKVGEEMAKYIINYEGGERIEIPIIGGRNVGEWWRPVSDLPEAEIAWQGINQEAGNIGLWLFTWKNPFPEKKIESIDIESNNKTGILCLVAISGDKGGEK